MALLCMWELDRNPANRLAIKTRSLWLPQIPYLSERKFFAGKTGELHSLKNLMRGWQGAHAAGFTESDAELYQPDPSSAPCPCRKRDFR